MSKISNLKAQIKALEALLKIEEEKEAKAKLEREKQKLPPSGAW